MNRNELYLKQFAKMADLPIKTETSNRSEPEQKPEQILREQQTELPTLSLRERVKPLLRVPNTAVVGVAVLVAIVTVFLVWNGTRGTEIAPSAETVKFASSATQANESFTAQSEAATDKAQSQNTVTVHIVGAVAKPGVYEINAEQRLQEALKAAGGATPDAALAAVNLARQLVDGEQILIPTEQEVANGNAAVATGPTQSQGKISINLSTPQQLEALPKIGPALAERIVEWRETNGGFKKIEDLLQVKGIGGSTFELLAEVVTL